MGFFDNLKKRKEAKALGLSVEQYEQFLMARSKGITLDDFRRYIASLNAKYSLDQYVQYLQLEGAGFSAAQCERYFAELSGKVAVSDYADFLAAEQLGLSVSGYAVYAASLKGTMSAVDYVGFLNAQKLGITMGKYLKYLKSFQGEMTVEEYDTYLKAEEKGMDRERYMEYLQKYKEQYTIERYLEFDKARSSGMTLEAPTDHPESREMGISAEKDAIEPDIAPANQATEETVPEVQTVAVTFAKHLIMNIPDGYVCSTDHAVIGMNRALIAMQNDETANYQDPYSAAKSITVLNGHVIPGIQEADTIAESIGLADARILVKEGNLNIRYSVRESTEELTIIQALICTETRFFPAQFFFNGITDTAFESGVCDILLSIRPVAASVAAADEQPVPAETPAQPIAMGEEAEEKPCAPGHEPQKLQARVARFFAKLQAAYPDKVVVGLDKDHKHLAETAVTLYRALGYESKQDFFAAYGYSVGIPENRGGRPRKDHMAVVEELKRRYADGPVCKTMAELTAANSDLAPRFHNLSNQASTLFGMPLAKYFSQEGILAAKSNPASAEASYEEEFAKLKSHYAQAPFAGTFRELKAANPQINWRVISKHHGGTSGELKDFLVAQGILAKNDRVAAQRNKIECKEAEVIAHEEIRQAEISRPGIAAHYEPRVYHVEEICVSGKEAEDWKTVEYWASHPGEIFIEDYLGTREHVVIPVQINGKKVSGLSSFALKTCKAKTVEIPGYYQTVPHGLAFQNSNITSIVIGEGIETLEDSVCFHTPNLEYVKVSRSVKMVYGNCAFKSTKWYRNQGDYVIVGTVLLYYEGTGPDIYVPHGVTTVAKLFAALKNIRKVVLPETVTTLCEDAFSGRGNENIREFVFTESLVNIGSNAFGRNHWLDRFGDQPVIINNQFYAWKAPESTLVVPAGVVKICAGAFKGNTTIQKVVLPETLKIIGDQAFAGCQNLQTIEAPEGLETLGNACFYRCNKLTQVILPDSLLEVGRSAFDSCTSLTEIRLGAQTEVIGENAFQECPNLRTVRMFDKVKRIGTNAFYKCTALKTIPLSGNLYEIGSFAFAACTSLETIQIPETVKTIGDSAFYDCKSLREVSLTTGLEALADMVFCGCEMLQKIQLPRKLGRQALSGCKSLTSVVLAEGTETIPERCFASCSDLKEITLPSGLTTIGDSAFSGCSSLEGIVLPAGLKEIGVSAFSGCSGITQLVIPETVTSIKDNAFKDCTSLADVNMPATVSEFGIDVFTNTPYMKKAFGDFFIVDGVLSKYLGTDTEVQIPETVTTIGENAFAEARHVEVIMIPDTVTVIEKRVMGNESAWNSKPTPQLKKLLIGNGVTEIGEEAFCDCEKLSEVTFGKGLQVVASQAFADCTALKTIDLSATAISEIKQEAFRGCRNVKKLLLPAAVEVIGRGAFSGISVDKVTLPETVRTVERSSFDRVSELIVYDTIDPHAAEATQWEFHRWNGSVNSALACAMLSVPNGYMECEGNTYWRDYHITVLSAETGSIRYRIYCDSEERDAYRAMMFSAWGKHASFAFELYDEYFMQTRNMSGRTEMAFCRIEHPEGLSAKHRANYEAFLERCMFIERSAKRTTEMIADTDAVERLRILHQYRAIDAHNIGWIRQRLEAKQAVKCLQFLDELFPR